MILELLGFEVNVFHAALTEGRDSAQWELHLKRGTCKEASLVLAGHQLSPLCTSPGAPGDAVPALVDSGSANSARCPASTGAAAGGGSSAPGGQLGGGRSALWPSSRRSDHPWGAPTSIFLSWIFLPQCTRFLHGCRSIS